MTEAYAIKGPDGKIDFVEIDADLETVWYEFIKSVEGRIPTSGSLVKDIEYWKNEGYTCVPVTVSENGEADDLLRECLDWGLPDDLKHRIDGYLSRGQR